MGNPLADRYIVPWSGVDIPVQTHCCTGFTINIPIGATEQMAIVNELSSNCPTVWRRRKQRLPMIEMVCPNIKNVNTQKEMRLPDPMTKTARKKIENIAPNVNADFAKMESILL